MWARLSDLELVPTVRSAIQVSARKLWGQGQLEPLQPL